MAAKSPLQAADPARSSAADVVAPINAAEDAVRAQQDTGSALAKATASQGTAAKAAADAKELWREEERTASGKATPGEEVGEAAVKVRELPQYRSHSYTSTGKSVRAPVDREGTRATENSFSMRKRPKQAWGCFGHGGSRDRMSG